MPPSGVSNPFVAPFPGWREAALLLAGASGLIAIMLIAGRMVCPGPGCTLPAIDRGILDTLHGVRTPPIDLAMMLVTWLGSMAVLVPLAVLETWRSRLPGADRYFLAVALASGWIVIHGLKWLIDRPRPDLFSPLVAMPADASFPSAHVAQVSILVTAWLVTRRPDPAWAFWLAGLAVIALVGLSRLYLQVHFFTDVLAGLLLGVIWVVLLRSALRRVER